MRWGDGGRGSGEERDGKEEGGGRVACRRVGGRGRAVLTNLGGGEDHLRGPTNHQPGEGHGGCGEHRVTFSHDIFNPPRAATARPRI